MSRYFVRNGSYAYQELPVKEIDTGKTFTLTQPKNLFDEDEKIYDLTREYAKKHELQIVVVAYKKKKTMHGMTVRTDCGPLEFLELFYYAKHIITTSFHGTVFSILFHKDFHY